MAQPLHAPLKQRLRGKERVIERQRHGTTHKQLTLTFTGDVMLGRLMNDAIQMHGPLYPWGNTIDLLKNSTLTLINLECVIASNGNPWTRTPKVFHFRADPQSIETLKAAGVDYVSLANNHTLDFEEAAMLEMLGRLDGAGIARAGAGNNLEEARQPAWLNADNTKVAVISFTDNEPTWAASETSPGVNYVPISTSGERLSNLKEDIRRAKADGADIVVVSAHWGPNMQQRPTPSQVAFAHDLMDAGCDVFHGHSAHIFQGIEIYKGKPILYDTGDFVDDYSVDPDLRNDQSAIFQLRLEENAPVLIDIWPTIIEDFQVNLAKRTDFEEIANRIQRLCREMGTDVIATNGQLRITI